ncbi:MAG: 50S ribosomal protein L32 [Candidatus Staskawiczbacteria bacterium]|nr:50S ribosomal protein L32 [Candidatus Staskawiczbacteria bacterium]
MAVPKQGHTRAKVGKSRMHKYIKPVHLNICPKCKKPVLSHTVCLNCGFYKGQEVINVLASLTKKEKKIKEKELKQAEQQEKKDSPMTMEELTKK